MEVLKTNFLEQLANFSSLLSTTDVIGYDLEMAGINGDRTYSTDFPFEFYNKTYFAPNKYQIIQVGLCLFSKTEAKENEASDSESYTAYPFSFYVFPSTVRGRMDKDLTMELGSIEFNVGAGGVDFNKWIINGLPYFDKIGLEKAKKAFMGERFFVNPEYTYKLYHEDQKEEYEELLAKFKQWYETKGNELDCLEDAFDDAKLGHLKEKQMVFCIQSSSYNVTKKLKLYGMKEMKNIQFLSFDVSAKDSELRVYKGSKESLEKLEKMNKEFMQKKFEEIKGFTLIWESLKEAIKKKNIPMIGHNSYGDISFLMSHFEQRNNPDYIDYKKRVAGVFQGGLFDTKNISRLIQPENGRLPLGKLYDQYEKINKVSVTIGEGYEFKEGVLHNAGYDAYITGMCFMHIKKLLNDPEALLKQKNKVKMFGVHNYMIDFANEKNDEVTNPNLYAILLNEDHFKALKEKEQKESMNKLISEFSKMYVEKKKKIKIDKKNSNYDKAAFFAFADSVGNMVKKEFSKDEVRVYDHPRASYFGNQFMLPAEIMTPKNLEKMKDKLGEYAQVVLMDEAYEKYLKIYMEKFVKKQK